MSVAILIGITLRDSLAPMRAALKVNVVNVGASVDDIDINALTTVVGVEVLVEGAEGKGVAVRDTGKTPWRVLLDVWVFVGERVHLLIFLDVVDLAS